MIDVVDKKTRSKIMAAIKSKNTQPEMKLRRALHARGFRYRLNVKHLPGTPDLLFPKYGAAVFVNGCFWHQHEGCRHARMPASRRGYWQDKFAANQVRDRSAHHNLAHKDWRVATVWECALGKPELVSATAEIVSQWLQSGELTLDIGEDYVSP